MVRATHVILYSSINKIREIELVFDMLESAINGEAVDVNVRLAQNQPSKRYALYSQ